MSFTTWTPPALAAEARRQTLQLWRAVEAQHRVSTRRLVDTLAEQALLEDLLDASKPPLPAQAAQLHYLLATPFRYPPTQYGSRFRAVGDPGVWYGSDKLATACAELGYWRCRFVADSAGLTRLDGVAHTLFRAKAKGQCVDLRAAAFAADTASWMHPSNYDRCQQLARQARLAKLAVIRYASVREPAHGGCAAVLEPQAFAGDDVISETQTWFLSVDAHLATWIPSGAAHKAPTALEFRYA